MNFRKRGGLLQSNFFFLQILVPPEKKRNIDIRSGGGSKAVWTLSENSSDLVDPIVP